MAAPSNRPNPNARNSEINNPLRRSFSGNPLVKPSIITNPRGFNPSTPANSPSDFPRRNSISRESVGSLRDYEDKENGKNSNPKSARVRSPGVSNGTKNFMSPTISAASKITASPRKKVLADRNEPVRFSVSFSVAKIPSMEDNDAKSDVGLNQKKFEASQDSTITDLDHEEGFTNDEVFDSKVPLSSKNDSDSYSKPVSVEKNCVNVDASFKISPSPSILAPLDADPSLPPYDPKTNYLSPRPQFLHYRPNPRIELYLNKEKECKRLEESFSDTEFTEETQSEDSQRESEDVSSCGMGEKDKAEEEIHVSEPNPSSIHMPQESVEAKVVSKPHFFTRSKFIALVLLLAISCLSVSVTDSPVIDHSVIKDLSFYKMYVPSEITVLANANFDGLSRSLQLWAANSFSYICKLISSLGEVHKLGPLQYSNLTSLLEDRLVDGFFTLDHTVLEPIRREVEIEPLEEKGEPEIEAGDDIDEFVEGDNYAGLEEQVPQEIEEHDNIEEVLEEECDPESEKVHQDIEAEMTKPDISEAKQTQDRVEYTLHIAMESPSDINLKDNLVLFSQPVEIGPKLSEAGEPQCENDINICAEIESTKAEDYPDNLDLFTSTGKSQGSEAVDSKINWFEDKFSTQNIVGISLLVLSLLAATAFICSKKGKTSTPNAAINLGQPMLTKKLDYSPTLTQERPSLRNLQTEVDMVGESCPSEMSSLQKSSSFTKGLKGTSEAHSHERKPRKNYRRESLASSSEYSMDSHSYGSFTTYEKIPSKHVLKRYGDDEVVTPVRRSSRIKNKVTSP